MRVEQILKLKEVLYYIVSKGNKVTKIQRQIVYLRNELR